MCNLQMELYTEKIGEEMGPAARLLPQAALQNRILAALQPEVRLHCGCCCCCWRCSCSAAVGVAHVAVASGAATVQLHG